MRTYEVVLRGGPRGGERLAVTRDILDFGLRTYGPMDRPTRLGEGPVDRGLVIHNYVYRGHHRSDGESVRVWYVMEWEDPNAGKAAQVADLKAELADERARARTLEDRVATMASGRAKDHEEALAAISAAHRLLDDPAMVWAARAVLEAWKDSPRNG